MKKIIIDGYEIIVENGIFTQASFKDYDGNEINIELGEKMQMEFLERRREEFKEDNERRRHIDNFLRDDSLFERYLEENYDKELTTAIMAKKFGYSAEHFCRKFKEATGLTPMNYLKVFRMEEAYKMLQLGERNISKVAEGCGFTDANYFTRCFKTHFGYPPSKIKQ